MADDRYNTIQGLLKVGHIKKFTEIFNHIPHTVVAKDFGTNNNRMKSMIADPAMWTLNELYKLADLIGYNRKKLAEMAVEELGAIRKAEKGN